MFPFSEHRRLLPARSLASISPRATPRPLCARSQLLAADTSPANACQKIFARGGTGKRRPGFGDAFMLRISRLPYDPVESVGYFPYEICLTDSDAIVAQDVVSCGDVKIDIGQRMLQQEHFATHRMVRLPGQTNFTVGAI